MKLLLHKVTRRVWLLYNKIILRTILSYVYLEYVLYDYAWKTNIRQSYHGWLSNQCCSCVSF